MLLIVSNYVYTSLIELFKNQYTKYYNENFEGSEQQHINDSFFKVLDKCNSEYGGFNIEITTNGQKQTLKQFNEQNANHRLLERTFIAFEKKDKDKEENDPKYKEWKNKTQDKIKQYNDTLKISISYKEDSSCVLYLTDSNWDKYTKEEQRYKNLLFIGPVTNIGDFWLSDCRHLVSVDFIGLTSLTSVGHLWLTGCKKLSNVNFTGLNNLQRVRDNWLSHCKKLINVNFTTLSLLTSVGTHWLSEYKFSKC